jgi:hypothetical protein
VYKKISTNLIYYILVEYHPKRPGGVVCRGARMAIGVNEAVSVGSAVIKKASEEKAILLQFD